jgi:uncharacterized membrane protein YcaP (DUF421 family)
LEKYLVVIGSTAAVYLFIIVAIRLFGKKELAQLTVIDLVFILLISNAVQNAMVGEDATLLGGLIAAATLFLMNFLLKFLIYRFPSLGKAIQGEAIMLVYDGKVIKSNLERARITVEELEESAREHGVDGIGDVNLAVLEVDGNISILSNDYQSKSKRKKKHYRHTV